VKTHAAPVLLLSLNPPTMAVLPSPDSATEMPCPAFPTAPVPTSLRPCWVQTPPLRVEDPRRPGPLVVGTPAHDGGAAIGGQRDGDALSGVSNRAGTDQFVALLGPDTAAAVIDPRRPGPPVVERPAHNGGVAVVGQRDGEALGRASNRAGADQLVALLGPDTVAAGEDPRRPGDRIVGNATHDGGVAVGRQRDGPALLGESDHAGANQLRSLLRELRHRRGAETLDVVADRGYYDSQEILACEAAGITVTLPKPMTSSAMAAGRFGKQDFVYVAADDVYRCPAGERLTYRFTTEEAGKMLRRYWTTACETCALKARCTPGKERRISRWEHEAVLETVQDRLDRNPDKMRVRRQTVEHPFGTIKANFWPCNFNGLLPSL
jgi:hypothetical protein